MMFTTLLLATPLVFAPGADAGRGVEDVVFAHARHVHAPAVAVWTNRDEVIPRGQSVRVFFESETDAYVTVFRIDTDGRVEVLFPQGPWDNNFARGGSRYEVSSYGSRHAFRGDDFPGAGYVFAVASVEPFQYAPIAVGARWDYRELGHQGRVVGDPYVAISDLVDLIVPVGSDAYDYDIVHYYVDRRVDYPRFLCYDCHAYASYTTWNPYRDPCYRFSIVVYNDPYYYPFRAYGGTRVVFTRPKRLEPRFVFKERVGGRPDLVVESRRPVNDPGARRTVDRPATSRQFGGVGAVPTPRRRPPTEPDARRPTGNEGNSIRQPTRGGGVTRRPVSDAVPSTPARAPRLVPRRLGGSDEARPPAGATGAPASRPPAQARPTPRRLETTPRPTPTRAGGAGQPARPTPLRRPPGPARDPTPPTSAKSGTTRRPDPRSPPRRRPPGG